MEDKNNQEESNSNQNKYTSLCMLFGVAIGSSGIAIGEIFAHPEFGCFTVAIGMMIGMLIGRHFDLKKNQETEKENPDKKSGLDVDAN